MELALKTITTPSASRQSVAVRSSEYSIGCEAFLRFAGGFRFGAGLRFEAGFFRVELTCRALAPAAGSARP